MSEISAILGQHFAFASGRMGVLKQLLLTSSDRDRLLGASDLKEAERILTEIKLSSTIDQGLKKADEILPAITAWVRREAEDMSPLEKRPIFNILWLEEDAPYLSYLLKKHFKLVSAVSQEPLTSMTAYDPAALKALVESGERGTLPEHLIDFVTEAKEMKSPEPQDIDRAVAGYVCTVQKRLARMSGSAHIRTFVTHRIDLINIRTAMRHSEEEVDPLVFLQGGELDTRLLRGNPKTIATALEKSYLYTSVAKAIRRYDGNQNDLEQALAHVRADDIAHMWNVPLSIEPLFAFAALAHAQLKLLRALTIGKRAGLSPQEIKSMLPPFISATHYVL